jgi:hypothetical protein
MTEKKPIDYMSAPEQRAKQPTILGVCQKIARAAGPGREAQTFNALWSFWNFAQAWDDLIDESNWPKERKDLAWRALQEFTSDLLLNPLYREHAAEFRALFTSAICRAIDGDAMAASGDPEREALAPAVRCGDIDILAHVAYLAGGWELMREIGAARDYDKPDGRGNGS